MTSAYFDSITAKQHPNETLPELKMIGNLMRMLQVFPWNPHFAPQTRITAEE